jgi:hypothetical protein
MQKGSTRAIDSAGILAIERTDVAGDAGGVVEIDVRETLPAAPDSGNLPADLGAPVHHRLDYGIQTRDVPAACQDPDLSSLHLKSPHFAQVNYSL